MDTKANACLLIELAIKQGIVRDSPALRAAMGTDPIGLAQSILTRGAAHVVEQARRPAMAEEVAERKEGP